MYFMLQKDSAYDREFLMETNSDLELGVFSYRGFIYNFWELKNRIGAGRQNAVITFNPYWVRYSTNPGLEFRFAQWNLWVVLDHTCLHGIDRPDVQGVSTAFWNKIAAAFRTKNFRLWDFRRQLTGKGEATLRDRISGTVGLGYYLVNLAGLVNPAAVSGGIDYRSEFFAEGRYAFFLSRSWILNGWIQASATLGRENDVYQVYRLGLEGQKINSPGGWTMFLYYNLLDELPFRPRDRLLELGMRFYL
jgi:hypothetical protein